MADDSLDDFFAKKDKSKKKSKSKIKPDDIQAQDAPTKKKKSKPPKETETDGKVSDKKTQEDDEWNEFEEEQEVDYTGLRIKEMQVKKDEEEEEEEEQGQEEGEGLERKEGGPWRPIDSNRKQMAKQEQKQTPEPVTPVPEPPAATTDTSKPTVGKYVPPSRRGLAGGEAGVGGPAVTPARRKKKEAPNLRSEHDFPTLGGGLGAMEGGSQFEEVKSGGRQAEDPTKPRHNLQLDNKFGALEDNDS